MGPQEDDDTALPGGVKRVFDEALAELVVAVLSNIRVDPKYAGKPIEFFKRYEEQATETQLAAIRRSPLASSLMQLLEKWRALPEPRIELFSVLEIVQQLCIGTQSPHRLLSYLERDGRPKLDDVAFLRQVEFLTTDRYVTGRKLSSFEIDSVAAPLCTYIASGLEWPRVESTLLRMLVRRAYDVEKQKAETMTDSLTNRLIQKNWPAALVIPIAIVVGVSGALLPYAIGLGLLIVIAAWSATNLHSKSWSMLAIAGLALVSVTALSWPIRWGTAEIRESLRKLAREPPKAPARARSTASSELELLEKSVNRYPAGHINLRLARGWIVRCYVDGVGFPIEIVTLLDRSIAAGKHWW